MRVLLLGGTAEASKLASLLAGQSGISAILSFAGRTKEPRAPKIPYRIGGFGGVEGLEAYLEAERIDVLVDATHPFADQMSRHAVHCGGARENTARRSLAPRLARGCLRTAGSRLPIWRRRPPRSDRIRSAFF